MTAPVQTKRLGYRPELDGVRGLAVLCIFAFHLAFIWPWFWHIGRGGFLSVDVFFVLSGMLITEILVADYERNGAVSLKSFYERRARRLLPALLFFMAATVVWYQLVHGTGHKIIRGIESVASYVTVGRFVGPFPPGVSQMWTLVVEWEFYFIWPILLVLLLRRNVPLRAIGYVAVAGALAIALARALLFHHDGGNYIYSYHVAWLRFEDLLAGCAVGLLGAKPQARSLGRTVALALIVAGTGNANFADRWVYYYGMLVAAVATAAIVQPRASTWWFDRVLSWPPVVWVGTVSYSFYLWSVFTISEVDHNLGSWPTALQLVVATIVSFLLAWASYELIENRFRIRSRRAPASSAP
jgi:peptidoglycan/LPS O-acetylase OafA/YrhL